MSCVFVVDAAQHPCTPVHPGAARRLLYKGQAAVWRRYPFTLMLRHAVAANEDDGPAAAPEPSPAAPAPLRLKLDPGSKTTGLALVDDATGQVVWAGEIAHRGQRVRDALLARRAIRCGRRQRHTRYRPQRFDNRRRSDGWLPPSLESRLANVLTWVARLRRVAPVGALSQELVKFDTQLLQNPEVDGVEYQQGELAGSEVREYLLEKWGRRCAYCGATGIPLEIEHVVPRSRGGSDRVSNLTLSCKACNDAKGTRTAAEFGYPEIAALAQRPLKDAAAVNATRWALYRRLQQTTGLPVETGSGGRTKWNRTRRGLPKAHWLDAACVGASTPTILRLWGVAPLRIMAMGRHSRQLCRTNAAGFPDKAPKATSVVAGFRTGDIVRAVVPTSSSKAGVYVGRLAIRATGSCNLQTASGTVEGIHVRYCQPLHRGDGYAYQTSGGAALPPQP